MENENKPLPFCFYILITILLISSSIFIYLLFSPSALTKTQNFVIKYVNIIGNKFIKNPTSISTTENPTPTISTNPSEVIPIKQGVETYNISQGKTDGPKIPKVTINPHDPKEGAKQTITVFTNHTKPINWVKVTVYSDNKMDVHSLSLSSGTNLSGTWSGSWNISDTHLFKWGFVIESGDDINQSRVGIAVR